MSSAAPPIDPRGPLVAFLGPSLDERTARAIVPDVQLLPPVSQGDLSTVLERVAPRAILIVDGEFAQSLSVWHKEILAALVDGIRVVGASSMGALRAAEMDRFGMEGVGEIYAHYRDGWLTEDADVALLHGDAESGYRPLTWPLANVRATVAELVRTGAVDDDEAATVLAAAHGVHFTERTAVTVAAALVGAGLDAGRARDVAALVRDRYVDQKARDAIAGFEHLARLDEIPPPPRDLPLHHDGRGFQPLRLSDIVIERKGGPIRRYQVIQDFALHDPEHDALLARALDRELYSWVAHDHGVEPTPAEEETVRVQVLRRLGEKEETLGEWLVVNDLSAERFAELVRQEATVARMRQWMLGTNLYDRSRRVVTEQLQLEGRYATVADAAARRRLLADSRPAMAHPRTDDEVIRLVSRQVVRTGWIPLPSLEVWADEHGFDSSASLVTALVDAEAADVELRERRARVARIFGIPDVGPTDPAAASAYRPPAPARPVRPARPGMASAPATSGAAGPVAVHAMIEAHQVSQVLLAAVDLGVPDVLADGPRPLADLAAAVGADPARLGRLLIGLQSLGLASATDGAWDLTPDGRTLVDPDGDAGPPGLAACARDLRASLLAAWAGLADVVRGEDPPGYPSDDVGDRSIAAASHALGLDRAVVAVLPQTPGIRVVDIGGGLGGRAERLLAWRPDLRLAVVELPGTAARAGDRLAARGLGDRIEVIAAGEADALAEPADVCVLERVVVTLDDATAAEVLSFAARSLAPGGRVVLVDLRADGTAAAAIGDLLNMARSGGGVRSVAGWAALAEAAGLAIVATTVLVSPFVRLVMEPTGVGA